MENTNKITANDYLLFRNMGEIIMKSFGTREDKLQRLKTLHRMVVTEETATVDALQKAIKYGGGRGFFGLKFALDKKLKAVENQDARAIGTFILNRAEGTVVHGDPNFGKGILRNATRLDTLRGQGKQYPGNRLVKRC